MPRDGIRSDIRGLTLSIVCEPCDRRARDSVERIIAKHGDVKLTESRMTLADCGKARSVSIDDRCKAVYEGL
jgi:hypothetical protein